jgi:type II secretory pathway pseudopilin PulG
MIPAKHVHQRRTLPSAYTLIEVCLAMALVGTFMSAIMMLHTTVLGVLRTAKDNAAASQALQERIEQMRIANWVQITDPTYIATKLMVEGNRSAGTLTLPVETISVLEYPEKLLATPLRVTRQNGVAKLDSSGSNLKDARMVRVDISLTWQGFPHKRQRARATTAIIAKGGISK